MIIRGKKKRAEGRGAARRPHTIVMESAQTVAVRILMPSVAAHDSILIRPFVAGLQYEITAELGDKGKKKERC